MSYQFNISDMGLRLIKAYEGFAPDGRLMRDGRKIVGYGRVTQDTDLIVSEKDAESMLKDDLSSIEDLINTNIHAAMTQSQFDALCSLAYSIGPKAFLSSNVLHAMNRGEIISAANGFDGWRLGNIDGNIYVVDALVRRRTAEKALFLRPTQRTVPAPHEALPAYEDDHLTDEKVATQINPDRVSTERNSNVVPLRRNSDVDDEPTFTVLADEVLTLNTEVSADVEEGETISPIAEAAAEVSDRLDALMDRSIDNELNDWPESLVDDPSQAVDFGNDDNFETISTSANVYSESYSETEYMGSADNHLVDDFHSEEAIDTNEVYESEGRYASADKYIQPGVTTAKQNLWTFITMIILGLTAVLGGFWANMKNSLFFGDLSPLIWSAGVALGMLLFLMGLYYLIKHMFGKS